MPDPTSTAPFRFGRLKVEVPLPPYWVPNKENKAVLALMVSNCPWHNAQPLGAKLKGTIATSDNQDSIPAAIDDLI
jgi:hypothetical protein